VVPPATLKTYATGKGNASKDAVLAAVVKRYPGWAVTGNDVADAVVLMAMGARLLGHPLESSLPQSHLRALDKLTLPQGATKGQP
jgi:crossover junction endodeoxyribonuclease RuvC